MTVTQTKCEDRTKWNEIKPNCTLYSTLQNRELIEEQRKEWIGLDLSVQWKNHF